MRGGAAGSGTGAARSCRGTVDPHQPLPFEAGIGATANLAEIDPLILAQRGNLDAGAVEVEAPTVITAGDGFAVEAAVVQRDAAVRTDVAQREHAAVACASDDHGLAQQRLRHQAAAPHVAAQPARRTKTHAAVRL